MWEALEAVLAIAFAAAMRENVGACWVQVPPVTGCAARTSASYQCPVLLPWQHQGSELAGFEVGLCSSVGGVDLLPNHCDFGRLVHFFAGGVRVSVGLQSTPDKLSPLGTEAGPRCLRACLCSEGLPCISPHFLPRVEGIFTRRWKGTRSQCGRVLSVRQDKGVSAL